MPIMAASILGVLSLYFYTKSLTEEIEGRKHNNSTFVKVLIGLGVIMAAPITMLIDFFVLPMIHALFVGAYSALQNNPVVEYKILDFLYEPKYQIPIIIGQWAIFIALAIVYKYEEKCFHRAL
jgi:hypothetical protein